MPLDLLPHLTCLPACTYNAYDWLDSPATPIAFSHTLLLVACLLPARQGWTRATGGARQRRHGGRWFGARGRGEGMTTRARHRLLWHLLPPDADSGTKQTPSPSRAFTPSSPALAFKTWRTSVTNLPSIYVCGETLPIFMPFPSANYGTAPRAYLPRDDIRRFHGGSDSGGVSRFQSRHSTFPICCPHAPRAYFNSSHTRSDHTRGGGTICW